jgi:cytochrome c peroxidase
MAVAALAATVVLGAGCRGGGRESLVRVDSAQLALFAPLPAAITTPERPATEAQVALGRRLFFETQLSLGNDLSCNSCHHLDAFGADTGSVSRGHAGKMGARNSPTVYNAAGHVAQFWDGRAPDVEAQALGPILNPVEMAMPSSPAVLARIARDPAYRSAFQAAFAADRNPVTWPNVGIAIGAFERQLTTPSRWDRFLRGEDTVLTNPEREGFNTFVDAGCAGCHAGTYVGGAMYQKVGLVHAWPDTSDVGRMGVTKQPEDRFIFKVPSLRNIERTGPYFHNGSVASLDTAIVRMGHYQLGKDLTPEQVTQIATWLRALTGELPADRITPPARATGGD